MLIGTLQASRICVEAAFVVFKKNWNFTISCYNQEILLFLFANLNTLQYFS